MRYLPKSESERREMLDACGVNSPEELFAHLPEAVRLNRPLDLAPGISEYEIVDYFRDRARRERQRLRHRFLGAGVYNHYRPVLVDTVVSRGEFLTSYTPYQAEISQGTLTTIFEFQTMICQLTGMDVANASMYDGSTAVPEAAMMAVRATGKGRVLVAKSVHPEYREVLRTYAQAPGHAGRRVRLRRGRRHDRSGRSRSEDGRSHRRGDRAVAQLLRHRGPGEGGGARSRTSAARCWSWSSPKRCRSGCCEPPADADIVAGELQSFAISPSYGGPYAGIIATKEKFIRQMPGRLVGQTVDSRGNRAFCLTLVDARAAHPPREGDLEHLHQPGADRADGDCLHDGLRQGGPARAGRAESGQGALPGRQADAALQRARSSTNSWRA